MSFGDPHAVIAARYRALIELGGDGGDPVLTEYDNLPGFTVPNSDTVFARFKVRPLTRRQATAGHPGSNVHRTTGIVLVSVFGPKALGAKPANDVADRVETALRGYAVSQTRLRTPSIEVVGLSPIHKWAWQVNVSTPFEHDEYT